MRSNTSGKINWVERSFIIAALCFLTGAFYSTYLYYTGVLGRAETAYNLGQSDPVQSALYVVIYIWAFAAFVHRPAYWGILRANPLVFAVLAIAALSFVWSIDPGVSLRRAIALTGTAFFSFYLAARLTFSEFVDIVADTIKLILLASVALYVISPDAATMAAPHAGDWRGVLAHKNGLGWVASFGLLIFYYLGIQQQRQIAKNCCYALLSLTLVFLSDSATSIVVAVLILALDLVMGLLQRMRSYFYVGYILSMVLVVGAALILWTPVLEWLHRDSSLTGRTDVWAFAFEAAARHPLLGYGYGAFWEAGNGPAAYIWTMLEWEFTHAHNGWLEIMLELGLVGVTAVFALVAQALYRCLDAIRRGRLAHARLMLVLLNLVLIANMTESGLAQYNDFGWVLILVVSIILGRYAATRDAVRSPVPARGAPALRPEAVRPPLSLGTRLGARQRTMRPPMA